MASSWSLGSGLKLSFCQTLFSDRTLEFKSSKSNLTLAEGLQVRRRDEEEKEPEAGKGEGKDFAAQKEHF